MRSSKYTSHLTSRIPPKTVCAFSRLRYDGAPLNTIGTRTHSYMPDLVIHALYFWAASLIGACWYPLIAKNFGFLFTMRYNISEMIASTQPIFLYMHPETYNPNRIAIYFPACAQDVRGNVSPVAPLDYFKIQG